MRRRQSFPIFAHHHLLLLLTLLASSTVGAAEPASARPRTGQPWVDMDYGPFLSASIEAPQPATNIAYKGIAIRLADAFGGQQNEAVVFDTDLLRYSAGWTGGFVALKGVVFDGEHWAYPQISGDQVFGTPNLPGWGNAGSFQDPRPFIYGPLPRTWAHWQGMYLHGQQVVLAYSVGETQILEQPGLERRGTLTAFTRTLNIEPTVRDQTLEVAFEAGQTLNLRQRTSLTPVDAGDASGVIARLDRPAPRTARTDPTPPPTTGLMAHWDFETADGNTVPDRVKRQPLALTQATIVPATARAGKALRFEGEGEARLPALPGLAFLEHDLTFAAWIQTTKDGVLFAQTAPEGPWVPDGKAFFLRGGRLSFDVGWVGAVAGQRPVADGRWHCVAFTWRRAEGAISLFVDGQPDGAGVLRPKGPLTNEVARLGFGAPNFPQSPRFAGLLDDVRFYERALKPDELAALAGPAPEPDQLVAAVVGTPPGAGWLSHAPGHLRLQLPAAKTPMRIKVLLARVAEKDLGRFGELVAQAAPPADLKPLTRGGPARWGETLETRGQRGPDNGPYALDTLTAPEVNPWNSWMRFGGFDFFKDATRAAISTWSGDVWIVEGIDDQLGRLRWRRFATGLYQPLGLKILDDRIYVLGRDQVTRLNDLDGDGEADFYENFNNDTMNTEHFHEFALDLEADAAGNLYYMKGARHARDALHPQHGTFMKISRDGQRSEILANGFRAPNGLAVTPDGQGFTTDQEGYWMPANRLNRIQPGGFHGNSWSWFPQGKPTNYVQPICWIHPRIDRSPSTMAWVTSDRWGPLQDRLLSLSYGVGRIFLVPHETVDGVMQGGVTPLPLEFDTGIMRCRFSPRDGQFYLCGLYGWAGNKTTPGGFYRVRYTGQPLRLPEEMHVARDGLVIRFSVPLDPASATDPGNYSLEQWNYRWTENYGSPDYKLDGQKGRDRVTVDTVALSADRRTIFLRIPTIRPVMQMHVQFNLRAADGAAIRTFLHQSIHVVGTRDGASWLGPDPIQAPPAARIKLAHEATGLVQSLNLLDKTGPNEGDTRVVRLPALRVPEGSLVTPFLPAGAFTAVWEGYLKLELADQYQFRYAGTGSVALTLNQREVPLIRAGSGVDTTPIPLQAGLNRLRLAHESLPNGAADFRLEWRGSQFDWEPVPPAALVHDAGDAGAAAGTARRLGRQLFAERLCIKCHAPGQPLGDHAMPELAADAPKLAQSVPRLRDAWLAAYLVQPGASRAETRMPTVLHGSAAETAAQARDLIAFMRTLTPPADSKPAAPSPDAALAAQGEGLFATLGCVACHTLPGLTPLPNDSRLSLANLGRKYQPAGLVAFLRDPSAAYKWIRMPDFQLKPDEASALAAYVLAKADPVTPEAAGPAGDPVRGRELATQSGCANCHDLAPLPGLSPAPVSLDQLARANPDAGCLAETVATRGRAPEFGWQPAEREALRSFLRQDLDSLRHPVWTEFAAQQVRALRCLACHEREDARDTWSAIEALTPVPSAAKNPYDEEENAATTIHRLRPPLTWAGEKLRPEWMEEFIAGRIAYKPRPKLPSRMPAFPAYASGLARGLALEHGHPWISPARPEPDPTLAKAGDALIRKGAFGCVDCHAVGTQPALAGADTVTINFAYVPQRLRREYYDHYLQDPPRWLPGTMMPRFIGDDGRTGITAYFEGRPAAQFEAIWHFLRTVPAP